MSIFASNCLTYGYVKFILATAQSVFPSFPLHRPPELLSSLSLPGKVNFTLEQTMKSLRVSTSIAHSFFNLGARWLWVVKVPSRSLYSRVKKSIILQEAGDPGSFWTVTDYLAPPGKDLRTDQSVASRCTKYPTPSNTYYHFVNHRTLQCYGLSAADSAII